MIETLDFPKDLAEMADTEPVEQSTAPTIRPLTLRSPNEILAIQFDDSDLVLGDRLMAKGQNASLCGASSVGKSRLALQLAVCCITKRPFLSFDTRGQGLRWLFVQAENSNRRLQFDLGNLRAWIGEQDWPLVNDNIVLHTLENDYDGFLNLDDERNRASIQDIIQQTRPDVVVFDSLYNLSVGDLNHDADMAATLQAISFLNRAGNPERIALVLHHAITGRAGAAKSIGYDRASFSRNSKILHAWTRGQINVAAGSPDSNDSLVLSCGKCSNGREFAPFAVSLNPKTFIYELDSAFDIEAWQAEMTGKRPTKKPGTPDDMQALVPHEEGILKPRLIDLWKDRYGNHQKGRAILDDLIANSRLFVWPVKRPGTSPAQLISRYRQPEAYK